MSRASYHDPVMDRATVIIGRSRIVQLVGRCIDVATAGLAASRAIGIARARVRAFAGLPEADRRSSAMVAIGIAVAGHAIIASMLPLPTRPTVALTAIALLGASLAAVAATARTR